MDGRNLRCETTECADGLGPSPAHRKRDTGGPPPPGAPGGGPRFDVEGGDGVYFLVDPESGDIRGTMLDQGGGWWKCRTPAGDQREVFVESSVPDPWLHVARRVGGT